MCLSKMYLCVCRTYSNNAFRTSHNSILYSIELTTMKVPGKEESGLVESTNLNRKEWFDIRLTEMQVLTNGIEVKLQRNALSVIETPTGNEDEDDLELERAQWNGSDIGEFDFICCNLV